MASKATSPIAFLLCLNLLFFTSVTSQTLTPASAPPPSSCNLLDFGVCVRLLGLPSIFLLTNPNAPAQCCSIIPGVLDANTQVVPCLCQRLRVLNIVNVTVAVRILVGLCGGGLPSNFTCPA